MITKHPCLSLLVVVIDKYITMKNLNLISEELFNKIRGRFPSVTIGDAQGKVTNIPTDARFFDFDYKEGDISLGKVNISLSDEAVEVMYSDNFVSEQDEITQQKWYNFLKELRQFSKKRMMKFDTRNINKSNLDLRDYKFLANNRGEETMSESKMYGTGRVSYQKVDGARLVVKHTESINTEIAGGRTRSIGKIYIESAEGERFMYPFKHLSGARAMARHVAEGGKPFDEFGTHIVGLSEEMNKLRKFKSYMGRSAVMAESLAGYNDVVNDRIKSVKKTIESLQKPKFYAETIGSFEAAIMEDVPDDVKENWIDQLTIKQFNEELSDVFPYIYKLVSEATKATELTPEDILGENDDVYPPRGDMEMDPSNMRGYEEDDLYTVQKGDTVYDLSKRSGTPVGDIIEINGLDDDGAIRAGDQLRVPNINQIGASPTTPGATRGIDPKDNYSADSFDRLVNQGKDSYESQLEDSFESLMGQFAEAKEETKVCKDCGDTFNKPTTDCKHDSHDPKGSHWVDADGNGIGDLDEGNAFSKALAKAKDDGDDEMEVDGKKIPVTEFILSMFDRESGQFPKGETAILTAIEKDYGEQYINHGKAFIEAITAKFEELNGSQDPMIDEDGILSERPFTDWEEAMKFAGDFEWGTEVDIAGRKHELTTIDGSDTPIWLPYPTTGKDLEIARERLKAMKKAANGGGVLDKIKKFAGFGEEQDSSHSTVMEPTVEQDDDLSDIRRLSGL